MMNEVIVELLKTLCVGVTINVGQFAVGWFRKWGQEQKAGKIREFLEQLGHASKAEIRGLVEGWLEGHPAPEIDEVRREEIIGLLTNLANGARITNTQGVVRSSFVRNSRLLDQLLQNIQPSRRRGEPVAGDHGWVLERFLGMGSFGEVWMARNPYFPTPRAFKFFTCDETLEMIRAEAATLCQVQSRIGGHPNVVKYENVAVDHPTDPYLALEYVSGGSLEDWILEDDDHRAKLDRGEAMRGIVAGLAVAHERGIHHRDMKPANVVLTGGPVPIPKITDFGLGHVINYRPMMSSALASQAAMVGTGMYLPPEAQSNLLTTEPAKDDVFAVGVIWYQLLVGRIERPPYDFALELRQAGVDSHTIRLIERCLARPEHRFPDAAALRDALVDNPPCPWVAPEGLLDVSYLFAEYHARRVG